MNDNMLDYVRRREAQERAAAKQASTLAARRAHQELAQFFAQVTCPIRMSPESHC